MHTNLKRISTILFLVVFTTALVLGAGIDKKTYTKWEKAAYLTDEEIAFIRPGLQLSIDSFTIPADTGIPVVVFSLRDDLGQPLDRDGILTPGSVSTSWVLSRINPGETQYTAYTTRVQTSPITGAVAVQPARDSGGVYTQLGDGVYQYTFGTQLPAGYPTDATTTLGVYATRDLRPFGLRREVSNVLHSFVPDGSQVKTVRDVVRTENCNECHNPLGLHGGSRREVGLCVLCHTSGVTDPDTGNTIDFKVMVHKIHRGADLPSVKAGTPYQIIGFRQRVEDFSDVEFPQDIRNCTKCHKVATQADNWFLNPTRATCGSCHDLVNFETGDGHAGGRQISDRFCSTCHFPEGELEFDASIKGGHTIPKKSKQLVGVNFEIGDVRNALPGLRPTIQFTIKNNAGLIIPVSGMAKLGVTMAGPTTDYSFRASDRPDQLLAQNPESVEQIGDIVSFTFTKALPADASGTYLFAVEGYVNTTLNPNSTKEMTVRDRGDSIFRYVAITDPEPVPRRAVVDDAKCNACHDKLIKHSGSSLRNGVQYCVACHNPLATDLSERPAAELPEETLDFRTFIHKLHTGHDLNRGFTLFDEGQPRDFSDTHFPGDRRDCESCHFPGTYQVPLPEGRLAVTTKRDFFSPTPPESAACLACHDSRPAAAHAFAMIAPFGEACAACHGPDDDFSITKVHAR